MAADARSWLYLVHTNSRNFAIFCETSAISIQFATTRTHLSSQSPEKGYKLAIRILELRARHSEAIAFLRLPVRLLYTVEPALPIPRARKCQNVR